MEWVGEGQWREESCPGVRRWRLPFSQLWPSPLQCWSGTGGLAKTLPAFRVPAHLSQDRKIVNPSIVRKLFSDFGWKLGTRALKS